MGDSMKKTKNQEFTVPNGKHPIFRHVKKLLRLFFGKTKITYLDGPIAPGSLMLCNHSAKKGPMALELCSENFYVMWGAHPMLGGYKDRYGYLRNVFYIQKKGYSPWLATPLAAFEAIFSIYFYRGMRVLPTYEDGRFIKTVNNSVACLESDVSVLVFPENSNEGYQDVMTEFHPGFTLLAKTYARKNPYKDLSIYPMYFHNKSNRLIIGKPISYALLCEKKLTKQEIAEYFRLSVNALYYEYILGAPVQEVPDPNKVLVEKTLF